MEKVECDAVVERDAGLLQWEHERIIIHNVTFERMLAIGKKNFAGMWTLYGFYFHKARKDGTNQPWALDKYCMKGLGWCKDKFYRYKLLLLEHGFIEQIVRRDIKGQYRKGEFGKSGAYFIKVNHMNSTTYVQCPENPDRGKNPIEVKSDTSALRKEQELLKKENNNRETEGDGFFDSQKTKPQPEGNTDISQVGVSDSQKTILQTEGIENSNVFKKTATDKIQEVIDRYFRSKKTKESNGEIIQSNSDLFFKIFHRMPDDWIKTKKEPISTSAPKKTKHEIEQSKIIAARFLQEETSEPVQRQPIDQKSIDDIKEKLGMKKEICEVGQ